MRSLRREKFFLYLLAACLLLSLGYVASRTLPLAAPAFEEWAYHVVSSDGDIQRFLSVEARQRVRLPSQPQQVDEHTNVDFGPLLEAFADIDISPEDYWPTRTHEVSVSVRGKKTVIVYHCVIEWFSWRVHDISKRQKQTTVHPQRANLVRLRRQEGLEGR